MKKSIKQFVKFSFVGGINTIIDAGIFFLLIKFMFLNYLIANVIAFFVAVTNSFFLNRSFTFKIKEKKKFDYHKFFVVSLVGLLISEVVLFVSVNEFSLNPMFGKFIAIVFTVVWNFFGTRNFVFKNRHE
jgi:putative flippase GtrA